MIRRFFNFIKRLFVRTPAVELPEDIPPVVVGEQFKNLILGKIKDATDQEVVMIKKAFAFLTEVYSSHFFREEILDANFTNTMGLSNYEIFQRLTTSEITINVEMFTGTWRQNKVYHTVGYDDGDEYVHANRYFVQDPITMMSLMAHETAHALGFHHDSASEYTSVPYMLNAITEKIAKELKLG